VMLSLCCVLLSLCCVFPAVLRSLCAVF
jgi:hypothetical protein